MAGYDAERLHDLAQKTIEEIGRDVFPDPESELFRETAHQIDILVLLANEDTDASVEALARQFELTDEKELGIAANTSIYKDLLKDFSFDTSYGGAASESVNDMFTTAARESAPMPTIAGNQRRENGKKLFAVWAGKINQAICDADSQLRKDLNKAIRLGTLPTLLVLAAFIGMGAAALPLLAPIVASILILGIDSYCEVHGPI